LAERVLKLSVEFANSLHSLTRELTEILDPREIKPAAPVT